MDENRFEILLDRYQSDEATPAEIAELEKLLRGNAGLRAVLVERSLLESHLRKAFAHEGFSATTVSPRRIRRIAGWSAAAAAVLLVGMVTLFLLPGRSGQPLNEVLSGKVSIGGAPVTRIPEGMPFEVTGNAADIQLSDGSRVIVAPSSKAEIQGRRGEARQVVKLTQGSGKFQVTRGSGRFRVETPVGAVVALGTEFTVKLRPPAKTDGKKAGPKGKLLMAVTVTDGSVQVDTKAKSYKLDKGDRRSFNDDGEQNNVDDGDQNNNDQDDGTKPGKKNKQGRKNAGNESNGNNK